MAAFNKFNAYVEELAKGTHQWHAHVFKLTLLNSVPDAAADAVRADLPAEISAGNGYSAGGMTLDSVSLTRSGGTAKLTIADEVLTASGGSIGPFRYPVLYNDTPTSPADPLVGWYDYGSSISLADTESFTVDFDGTNGVWTLA